MSNAVAKALYTTLKDDAEQPEMIDNPDYPGPDEPEMIDNPDYAGSLASISDEPRVKIYAGVASRDAKYPFITIMPIADVPILYHEDPSTSQTHWDLKIWAESMKDVGEIYDRIVEMFDNNMIADMIEGTDSSATLRGRGMPLMAEDNLPCTILYSRVIECEVVF